MRRPNLPLLFFLIAVFSIALGACGGAGKGGSAIGGQAGTGGGGGAGGSPGGGPVYLVSGWLPYWSYTTGGQAIAQYGALLDEVHPTWYTVRADATLGLHTGARNAQLIADLRSRGLLVLPMIDDFGSGSPSSTCIRSATLRAKLVQSIVDEVLRVDADGIDIDFEALASTDRDLFSAFIADLARALHAHGKLLAAAVYGKSSEPGSWSGPRSHDYAAIGREVDRLQLMAYGYSGSRTAGPIGPAFWVEQVAALAASLVAPQKVLLGVPFYGMDFSNGSSDPLSTPEAESLIASTGATVSFDARAAEPTFQYTDARGVRHTVWYQDGPAMAAKIEIAKRYGLAGIAIWELGRQGPSLWSEVRTRLKPGVP